MRFANARPSYSAAISRATSREAKLKQPHTSKITGSEGSSNYRDFVAVACSEYLIFISGRISRLSVQPVAITTYYNWVPK